jgi:anaerobic selenocysteine-containing dehydrogenase
VGRSSDARGAAIVDTGGVAGTSDPRVSELIRFGRDREAAALAGTTSTYATFCRICAAACGILVTVGEGGRVERVRGDPDHPASRGYVCPKGRALGAWHHRADRLDHPRLRGEPAGWDEVLDDLGARVTAIVDGQGPDAVGLYLATGLAYDAAGQVAAPTWLASIGSRSFYTAVTVDNAPVLVAAELVAGHPMLNPVWDAAGDGVLVLVGTNPVVSHGYGTTLPDPIRHLREYRARGGRVWVLDPRRTETAAQADEHVPVRPGADAVVLAAIAGAVLTDVVAAGRTVRATSEDLAALQEVLAPYSVERVARAAGIDAGALQQLVDEVVAAPGRVAVMCGTGTTMSLDGVLVEWLRWVVLALTDSLDRPGGMVFHDGPFGRLRSPRARGAPDPGPPSRPELPRVAGQLPAAALVDEVEQGNLRALVVTGGDPITAFPDPDRVRAALGRLDVLAVVDVVDGELCDLATHVLPATGQLERADITLASPLSVRSAVQATGPVVEPTGARRPSWWIVAELARRTGCDLTGGVDPSSLDDEGYLRSVLHHSPVDADELFAAGPHGLPIPVEHGWVTASLLDGGCWRLAPPVLVERLRGHRPPDEPLVLAPRRETAWSNSVRYGEGDPPVVRLHPADADAAGVADRDLVEVRSEHGTVVASVLVDPGVRSGVVSMTHGHRDASPGLLTSSREDVDPLTAMPRASGVPVSVSRRG